MACRLRASGGGARGAGCSRRCRGKCPSILGVAHLAPATLNPLTRATAQATLFGEPFPWLGSWSEKLYWALRTFGLSSQGIRHKAGKGSRGGKDIWWNEDGSFDFVDSDDIVRS